MIQETSNNVVPLFKNQHNAIDIFGSQDPVELAGSRPVEEENFHQSYEMILKEVEHISELIDEAVDNINLPNTEDDFSSIQDRSIITEALTRMLFRKCGHEHPFHQLAETLIELQSVDETSAIVSVNYKTLDEMLNG